MDRMKQVLVVNEALKLPRGKLAAQVAHASLAAFLEAGDNERVDWLEDGMPKIVLAVKDEEELFRLQELAGQKGIAASIIADAGRTVLEEGTITCLGLGPARVEAIDEITGDLKLL